MTGASVNPGFVAAQLAAATAAAENADAPTAMEAADKRIRDWLSVVAGMSSGTLSIGSRTPVQGFPPWVTLKVAHGGFATGAAAAELPLTEEEVAVAMRAGVLAERGALNSYYLTSAGLEELVAAMESGSCRLQLPEDAVLPLVAYLTRHGEDTAALSILSAIHPFLSRLRFAPPPPRAGEAPRAEQEAVRSVDTVPVCLKQVADVTEAVMQMKTNTGRRTQREAIMVWAPLNDESVSLWLEVMPASDDEPFSPCLPAAWYDRARAHLARYDFAAEQHTLCTKHKRRGENGCVLRTIMRAIVSGEMRTLEAGPAKQLRGRVRQMIAKRGRPGSKRHAQLRQAQTSRHIGRPTIEDITPVVLSRLNALSQDRGLTQEEIEAVSSPIAANEATLAAAEATQMPRNLVRLLNRALEAPLPDLLSKGVVASAESLAALVPQLVGAAHAHRYSDGVLAQLMAEHHVAFSKRRSLLLLNLEHQVEEEELPWIAALGPLKDRDRARGTERSVLQHVFRSFLTYFPGTLMPNVMVRQLKSLEVTAADGETLPLTEELAADIFMGTFSFKFQRAAKQAARLLQGSVYDAYYATEYSKVLQLADQDPEQAPLYSWRSPTADAFTALCSKRAESVRAADGNKFRFVAKNGTVIEQQQILTTHNLAVLAGAVKGVDSSTWSVAARRAFSTVCSLTLKANRKPAWMGRLDAKQAAFAWRQVVFFAAMAGHEEWPALALELDSAVMSLKDEDVRAVLKALLSGLATAAIQDSTPVQPVLGWCGSGHPLLKAEAAGESVEMEEG